MASYAPDGEHVLAPDQAVASINGLESRLQLLQGPPGTGKTTTTAAAVLLRILVEREPGDIVLVAAHTHTAVNTLLLKLDETLERFSEHASNHGRTLPPVTLTKVHSSTVEATGAGIDDFRSTSCIMRVRRWRRDGVVSGWRNH